MIASLWQVDDQATGLLMRAFYQRLKDGQGKAEALQAAQREVRATYPHPFYWASFVLTGDPGPITASRTADALTPASAVATEAPQGAGSAVTGASTPESAGRPAPAAGAQSHQGSAPSGWVLGGGVMAGIVLLAAAVILIRRRAAR